MSGWPRCCQSTRETCVPRVRAAEPKIVTDFWMKPIPARDYDWTAVDDDTYDGEGPVGTGATEAEAIADLREKLK